MNKHLYRTGLFVSCALAILALNGCVTIEQPSIHDFVSQYPAPRPFTPKMSYAMQKINSDFTGYSERTLGCFADTAIYEDEVGKVLGGFDPYEVHELTLGGGWTPTQIKEKKQSVITKYGTIPGNLRAEFTEQDNSLEQLGSAMVMGAAPRNFVTYDPSVKVSGGGLALGLGLSLLMSTESERARDLAKEEITKYFKYRILSYRLAPEEQQELETKGLFPPTSSEDAGKLADYFVERILNVMAESVKELGYSPVGEIVKYKPEQATSGFYQWAMEGKDCPEPNLTEPWKSCCFRIPNAKNGDNSPFSIRLGRNNAPTANVMFDDLFETVIYVPEKTNRFHWELTEKLAEVMAKKSPNITFYIPAEEEEDGTWSPQRVLDQKGTHYFVVPVKREAEKI